MVLTAYKERRNFKETPEPTGGKSEGNKLRFVIQMHDASHLHYDFRIEMDGVLKSWAIPKGPSTDPKVKRLAVMVEDHPFDYRNFEGIIPSGYGAGTVLIWDEGYYEPVCMTSENKKNQDKELKHQLQIGKLKIRLHGKKLHGDFALIKAHGKGEDSWLLYKLNDEHASEEEITLHDRSVVSHRNLSQIAKANNFYDAKRVKEASLKFKKEVVTNKYKNVLPIIAEQPQGIEVKEKAAKPVAKKIAAKRTPAKRKMRKIMIMVKKLF